MGWSWSAGVNTAKTQPQAGGTPRVPTGGRWGCSLGTSVGTGLWGPCSLPQCTQRGTGPQRGGGRPGLPGEGWVGCFPDPGSVLLSQAPPVRKPALAWKVPMSTAPSTQDAPPTPSQLLLRSPLSAHLLGRFPAMSPARLNRPPRLCCKRVPARPPPQCTPGPGQPQLGASVSGCGGCRHHT